MQAANNRKEADDAKQRYGAAMKKQIELSKELKAAQAAAKGSPALQAQLDKARADLAAQVRRTC